MAKNIRGCLENLFEYYFFNTIVNAEFFSDLQVEYDCNANLKYCYQYVLNRKQLIWGVIKYFPKILPDHEIFRSIVSWATKFFLEKPSDLPSYIFTPTESFFKFLFIYYFTFTASCFLLFELICNYMGIVFFNVMYHLHRNIIFYLFTQSYQLCIMKKIKNF